MVAFIRPDLIRLKSSISHLELEYRNQSILKNNEKGHICFSIRKSWLIETDLLYFSVFPFIFLRVPFNEGLFFSSSAPSTVNHFLKRPSISVKLTTCEQDETQRLTHRWRLVPPFIMLNIFVSIFLEIIHNEIYRTNRACNHGLHLVDHSRHNATESSKPRNIFCTYINFVWLDLLTYLSFHNNCGVGLKPTLSALRYSNSDL